MKLDAGEASSSATPLSSSGSAMRPSATMSFHASGGIGAASLPMLVRNGPGAIAFTCTPCFASSSAAWRTMMITAALVAE
jgi:hypothetical protein